MISMANVWISENQVLCRIDQTLGRGPDPEIEKERKNCIKSGVWQKRVRSLFLDKLQKHKLFPWFQKRNMIQVSMV